MRQTNLNEPLLQEEMASAFRRHPSTGIKAAWNAYVSDKLTLAEAASVIGVSTKQFLEIGSRCISGYEPNVPCTLWEIASEHERELFTYLSERQINLLEKAKEQDIVLPLHKTFASSLWEDLHMLEAFRLLKSGRKRELWRYSLTMGRPVF